MISERVARYLERQGWLARDEDSPYLTLQLQVEDAMQQVQGHSIMYRIAVGPQAGRNVLTLQTIPAWEEDGCGNRKVGKIGGFSLHAGVAVNTRERKKLAALVARPRTSLTRFHGVLAPDSRHRTAVTPARCSKANQQDTDAQINKEPPADNRPEPRAPPPGRQVDGVKHRQRMNKATQGRGGQGDACGLRIHHQRNVREWGDSGSKGD